ncbi:MAG TPA: DUF192 domain-containing protein [Polyangiales bacterium]|nr:DUF192 domain-containing protein [Polyangiales bacterium]
MFRRLAWLACVLAPMLFLQCAPPADGAAQAPAQTASSKDKQDKAKAAASSKVVLLPVGQDPVTVRVEVVSTDEARQQGLMFRRQLAPDAGMLFVFEEARELTFWMHNTYLPLDMIFITSDLAILGVVENATPLTDTPRRVPGVSRYVLEVNAGFARAHGLTAGTRLRFVDVPNATPR